MNFGSHASGLGECIHALVMVDVRPPIAPPDIVEVDTRIRRTWCLSETPIKLRYALRLVSANPTRSRNARHRGDDGKYSNPIATVTARAAVSSNLLYPKSG